MTILGAAGIARPAPRTQAFDTALGRERPRLVAIATRILGDRAAAEDVAQDALLAFVRTSHDVARAGAWLHAATVHRAYNMLRDDRRRREREVREHLGARGDGDLDGDPARAAERAETRAIVRAALARVGERHASVLALRYAGLTYREVAAALAIPVASVGMRLARAEAAFAKLLMPMESER